MRLGVAAILAVSALAAGFITSLNDTARAAGDFKERWSCGDALSIALDPAGAAFTLTAICSPNGVCSGKVKISKFPIIGTWFRLSGLNRHWAWGKDQRADGEPRYRFIITPTGKGAYFDIGNASIGATKMEADQVFACEEESR